MKKHEFYAKYPTTPIEDRFKLLSNDSTSPLVDMSLHMVYMEIKQIDDKLRNDEIRREELLEAVEPFLSNNE